MLILPLGAAFLRNDPRDKRLEPYGATPTAQGSDGSTSSQARRVSITEAAQTPAFWLLVATYFICGYTSGGLVGTHLIPMPSSTDSRRWRRLRRSV